MMTLAWRLGLGVMSTSANRDLTCIKEHDDKGIWVHSGGRIAFGSPHGAHGRKGHLD